MKESKSKKMIIGSSALLAITSSLCCILPILSIFGAISGLASSLSWVELIRPYLILSTVIILGFAFYQAYKPKKVDDCGCAVKEKNSFLSSKGCLWSTTIVSGLLMSFPYYGHILNSYPETRTISFDKNNIEASTLNIEGMSCKACENHVNNALLRQVGVLEATSDYEKGLAEVKYDKTKITLEELALTTQKETGYTVIP